MSLRRLIACTQRVAFAALTALALLPATVCAADAGRERTLSPYFVVERAEAGVDALPLKSTAVEVHIAGVIADVKVRQRYRNEGERPLEARYVFPASTRAAVNALTMKIGDRVVQAEIREKQAARRDYEGAKREGKSASLLEQQRPNVFQMSIANLMPGDDIEVELRYSELIVPDDGVYRFVYPTVVGPRYNGARGRESHQAEPWIAQPTLRAGVPPKATFGMTLTLDAPMPVQSLTSPSHRLTIDGVGSGRVRAALAEAAEHADRDVVLDYRLAGREIASGVLVHEGQDENFFVAMVEPPARTPAAAIVPREYVFILDVSGSMHGFPIETAKTLLHGLVGNLRPTDTFNIILFSGGHSLLAPRSLPATRENIEAARRFIASQRGSGSTELLAALRVALALPQRGGSCPQLRRHHRRLRLDREGSDGPGARASRRRQRVRVRHRLVGQPLPDRRPGARRPRRTVHRAQPAAGRGRGRPVPHLHRSAAADARFVSIFAGSTPTTSIRRSFPICSRCVRWSSAASSAAHRAARSRSAA